MDNSLVSHIGALSLKSIVSNIEIDIMSKLIEKFVIPLKHKKCYEWEYGGKNPYYATCPYCRNQVNIRKNAIGSEPMLLEGLTHPLSIAKGAVDSNG
jgi:hypothetical protein